MEKFYLGNKLSILLIVFIILVSGSKGFGKENKEKVLVATSSFTSNTVCEGLPTSFVNLSSSLSGTIILYSWDFKDGSSSSLAQPDHIFASSGTFLVDLTVLDDAGNSDVFSAPVVVLAKPSLSFNITSANQCENTIFEFTNTSNITGAASITSYTWDFGDATAVSNATDPTHDYATSGDYTLTLSAESNEACVSQITELVEVLPIPNISFEVEDVCLGSDAIFINNTTIASGNVSFSWDFDDGTSSTEINPKHAYTTENDYNVNLTVTTEGGCILSAAENITVNPQPIAGFTFSDVCLDQTASFTNTSTISAGISTYVWNLGDGSSTSSDLNPTYDYSNPNTYLVSLTVNSDQGCSDEISKNINVNPLPVAQFNVPDVCLGTNIEIDNQSAISSGTLTTAWNFGDGNVSAVENPSHAYISANSYSITLISTSDKSCTNQIIHDVTVFPTSVGGVVSSSMSLCAFDASVQTLSLSGHTGEVIRWESSLTNTAPWSSIAEESNSLIFSNLSVTTYYRAIVKSGECDETPSNVAIITIDQPSDGGEIIGSRSDVCNGGNTGTVSIAGYVGTVVEWQYSIVGSTSGFSAVANTNDFLDYSNLTTDTYYRAVVQNGQCIQVFSPVAEIILSAPTDAGILTGAATVCKGNNLGTLELNGFEGDIVSWQISENGLEPWALINSQNTTLEYENLLTSQYYRVRVKSGECNELQSNAILISVDENTEAGVITGTAKVCDAINDGELTLTDQVGDVVTWESSINGIDWTDLVYTNDSYDFTNLTETTYYRVWVQNNVCTLKSTDEFTVTVNPLPQVSFANTEVCNTLATDFTNTSTIASGTNDTFMWDFDGTIILAESPSFIFPSAGTFGVSLTITSDQGCESSVTQQVVVNPNPVAGFVHVDKCLNEAIEFTNSSSISEGSIANYLWDFGDSNTSDLSDPENLYANIGTYDVQLTVVSDANCSSNTSGQVEVFHRAQVNFSVDAVCNGTQIELENNSIIADGNLSYVWDFGDESTSTEISPKYLYGSSGTYQINLQVTSNNGCVDVLTVPVEIYPQPIASFSAENVCLEFPVVFENTSNEAGANVNYSWDFGDTNTGVETSPQKFYESFGLYKVSLTSTTDDGCVNTYSSDVIIEPMPQVQFSYDHVCDEEAAVFSNLSTVASGELSFEWDFGDANIDDLINTSHVYESDGSYEVTLTATSDFGCQVMRSSQIQIYPLPVVDFTAQFVCDGHESVFENLSSISVGAIENFTWDFGDQTNSILENPTKLYLNPDNYSVNLKAESDQQCINELTQEYIVYEPPIASFSVEDICFEELANISDQSLNFSSALRYEWDFGDGNSSFVSEPSHIYELPGEYAINLRVISTELCKDSLTRSIHVRTLPEAYAGEDTIVDKGFSVQLVASGGDYYSWSPITTLSNSNIPNPFATPLESTIYELEVSDIYGCSDFDEVEVVVSEEPIVVPSNVMTPDGNGINDSWVIDNIETFGSANVVVFDRWGKIVFDKKGYQNDWQGMSGSNALPDGTYYYTITFEEASKKYSGAITIIRN